MSDAQAPSFDRDIRSLFRDKDREAMESAFDLWDHGDVQANAGAILEAVQNGSMPCDGAWPPDRVALLRDWIEAGMPA